MRKYIDFAVQAKKGKVFTILQLTDMQIIDSAQRRFLERLCEKEALLWKTEMVEKNCYSHIRKLVEQTQPDLIIITGDIVYGEFDDSGSVLKNFLKFMGELNVPWAPVFGNHDNESKIGVEVQCKWYASAKNCLFSRGSVTGNSNYTVGIYEDNELVRILYMMDTNGCDRKKNSDSAICSDIGFADDQIRWLQGVADEAATEAGKKIPGFLCCHIPTADFCDAIVDAGYQTQEELSLPGGFSIGEEQQPFSIGDFGYKNEIITPEKCAQSMERILVSCGIDGEFSGHFHKINLSIQHGAVRYTLALKCGTYDYHEAEQLGGTKIVLGVERKDFAAEHIYYEL